MMQARPGIEITSVEEAQAALLHLPYTLALNVPEILNVLYLSLELSNFGKRKNLHPRTHVGMTHTSKPMIK